MNTLGYRTMFHGKKGLKQSNTSKTTKCMNKTGPRMFAKSVQDHHESIVAYDRALSFRPRG